MNSQEIVKINEYLMSTEILLKKKKNNIGGWKYGSVIAI